MDTKLLDRILDAARLAATGSEAMRIEDLQRELQLIPEGGNLADILVKGDDFDALKAHIETQPFDVLSENHDETPEEGRVILDELTPGAFIEWLGELERLAQ